MQIIDSKDSYNEMSVNAVKFVDSNFSWSAVAKDTVGQYSELLRSCK